MKKISIYKYLLLAVLAFGGLLVACNDDVEDLGKKEKPVLTADGSTSITVTEGNDAVLNFKLSKAINEPIQYRLVMLDESSATDQDDYVIPGCRSNDPDCVAIEENGGPVGYIFEIPAYTTEYSVNIATIFDDLGEGDEHLKLKVISNRTLLGTVGDLVYDIIIKNAVSDDLNIRLDWSGTFTSGTEIVENCTLDLDLELYDSDFNLIDNSYTNCPEGLILETATLPDGTYYLDASLWTTSGYFENVNIPANLTFVKPGTAFNETFNLSSLFPMQDGGLDDGNNNAIIEYTIVKAGNIYTITNPDGDTVFQGRQSKKPINSARLKKKNNPK
jgi:hypothetical protein